jgi:CBS domain-containing protein
VHPLLLGGALTCLDAFERCHDQKIEAVLLPALKDRQPSLSADTTNDLTREHEEIRRRIAALRSLLAGSLGLNAAICRLAEECVAYLRTHAVHEFEGLFTAAERVLTAEDAAPLWEAFRRIDEREIQPGERQALRALAEAIDPAQGHEHDAIPDVAGIVAAHVMRPRPRSVRPADTLARAAELMDRVGVRELPVVEDGRLCGIVSRTDLQPHLGHLEWTGVDAAMTANPVVVTPEQSAAAVSRVLLRGRFNAVPVIADETMLIGMVSRSDLLRAVADHVNGNGH